MSFSGVLKSYIIVGEVSHHLFLSSASLSLSYLFAANLRPRLVLVVASVIVEALAAILLLFLKGMLAELTAPIVLPVIIFPLLTPVKLVL
jgi:hypothetical protein